MRRRSLLTAAFVACLLTPGVAPSARNVKAQASDAPAPPPLSVAIVYDTSTLANQKRRGKSFDRKKELFNALSDFVRRANPRTEFFVIRFDMSARLTVGGTTDTHTVLRELSALAASPQEGGTSLFDACLFAVETVARGRRERRAIILLSDGTDTTSNHVSRDVAAALSRQRVTLYAVNIQTPDVQYPELYSRGNDVLNRLASESGGKLFQLEKEKAAITFFQTIADELSLHSPAGSR